MRANGYVEYDYAHDGALRFGPQARALAQGDRLVYFKPPREQPPVPPPEAEHAAFSASPLAQEPTSAPPRQPTATELLTIDRVGGSRANALFLALKAERDRLAARRHAHPYEVLSDTALREIAMTRPRTRADLAKLQLVGTQKANEFGNDVMKVVARHEDA
jgi:ATP-dependent DNA helicase RecQ